MVKILKTIKNFILKPYYSYKNKKAMKKRIEEIRKRDPFIYR